MLRSIGCKFRSLGPPLEFSPHSRKLATLCGLGLALCVGCDGSSGGDVAGDAEGVFPWPIQTSLGVGFFTTSGLPGTVLAEDFDADSDVDVIGVVPNGVSIRRNWQDGRLVSEPTILVPGASEVTTATRTTAAFHLLGDTFLDILVSTPSGHHVLRNSEGETFTVVATMVLQSPSEPSFVSGDMNNDGRRELMVMGPNAEISLVDFDAFVTPTLVPLVAAPPGYSHLDAMDIEGDGDCDLVLSVGGFGVADGTTFRPVFNQGASGFVLGDMVSVPGLAILASIDQDPQVEIVSRTMDAINVHEWNGPLLGPAVTVLQVDFGTYPRTALRVLDVDGDGLMDLSGIRDSTLYFQTAPLIFEEARHLPAGVSAILTPAAGGGPPDLLYVDRGAITIVDQVTPRVFVSWPELEFNETQFGRFLAAPLVTGGPLSYFALVRGATTGWVLHRLSLRGPEFVIESTFSFQLLNPTAITPADLNGDSNTDLLVQLGTEHHIYLGDGTGSFIDSRVVPGMPDRIYAGDLDQDGDTDFVAPLLGRIWINTGATGLAERPGPNFSALTGGTVSVSEFNFDDKNTDGLADLTLLTLQAGVPGGIAYGVAGSEPAFAAPVPIWTTSGSEFGVCIQELDLDADGDPDYVDRGTPQWLENGGSGLAVGPLRSYPEEFQQLSRFIADFDGGRGGNEVLIQRDGESELWRVVQGQPTRLTVPLGLPGNTSLLHFGDLNGDGFDDVVMLVGMRLFFLPNSGILR